MTKKSATPARRVPVSFRALMQRINRKLAKKEEQLCSNRSDHWSSDLGAYYVLNLRSNSITDDHVDPEALGREIGVLRPWEVVEEEK
jgi:hypothetical protein